VRRWLSRRPDAAESPGGQEREGRSSVDWATYQLEHRGVTDAAVLRAMRAVPRERFVPAKLARAAYDDGALPIGHGQTISQPYIVASMTQALALAEWSAARGGARPKVLDVGTGSGYQAAVLAELGAEVVSIERDPALSTAAGELLAELGYDVRLAVGDGSNGVPDEAPFAGIVVAAAAPSVPMPLVEQLLPNGRLVLPIGGRSEQSITLVQRTDSGFEQRVIEPAVFVPLVGEHGFGSR
jgi:protein-L-isoaspartate(D-aspartate) O-methyltransferase